MAGEEVAPVGRDPEGGLRTDPEGIQAAVEDVLGKAAETLAFVDSGSAVLSAEEVLGMLSSEQRDKVWLVDAPFVEGAFAAGVLASTGAGAAECVGAAVEARSESKLHG